MIQYALQYLKQGYPPIPSDRETKKPLVKWGIYRKKLPTTLEVKRWFRQWHNANIAIVTGKQSGVFILDIDDIDKARQWYIQLPNELKSAVVQTRKGVHIWYQGYAQNPLIYQDGNHIGEVKGSMPCTVPPSIHSSGHVYTWVVSLEQLQAASLLQLERTGISFQSPQQQKWHEWKAKCPQRLPKEICHSEQYAEQVLKNWFEEVAQLHPESEKRNIMLFKAACRLGNFVDALSQVTIESTLLEAAMQCGLGEDEARKTIVSGLGRI